MSYERNIEATDGWFIGEDKVLEFEVLQNDGLAITSTSKLPLDVAGWTLTWALKKKDSSPDPALVAKSTTSGITITGTFNASRVLNTQRVVVTIADTDTDALKPLTYRYSLKRMTAGYETILAFGNAVLQQATAPAELA